MVSDSSNTTEERVQKLLRDNDLEDALINIVSNGIYAFPIIEVLESLNNRLNKLEGK